MDDDSSDLKNPFLDPDNPLHALAVEEVKLLKLADEIQARLNAVKMAVQVLNEQYNPMYSGGPVTTLEAMEARSPVALGMTDRIRKLLQTKTDYGFSPVEVKGRLERDGFDFEGRSNPMAEIHTILKRLVAAGEAQEVGGSGPGRSYKWIYPNRRAPKKALAS